MASRVIGGPPSDELPDVLAAGRPDVGVIFVSMSARQPEGRDEDYLEWHSLDHRPEQYRVSGIRHSLRIVSTPACRAVRAAARGHYDSVDHVMTYFFTGTESLAPFNNLSNALGAERRPVPLPSVEYGLYGVSGRAAAPAAVTGSEVIPWRPARGVYLLLEQGSAPAADLCRVDGVAGVWWHDGLAITEPIPLDRRGLQLTYCYLEGDPVATAAALRAPLEERWEGQNIVPLLAAPFHTLVPFEWGRYLP